MYWPQGAKNVACGYCYAVSRIPGDDFPARPSQVDWRKPLYTAALTRPLHENLAFWTPFLSGYGDLPQRLEQYRQEMLRRQRETILAAQELLKKTDLTDEAIDSAIRSLSKLPPDDRIAPLIFKLRHRRLVFFSSKAEALPEDAPIHSIDSVIDNLKAMEGTEGQEEALKAAHEKKARMEQALKEKREKERRIHRRRERRRRRLRVAFAAMCVILPLTYWALSYHIFQPETLEQARVCFRAGNYAQGEKLYRQISGNSPFINSAVSAAAQSELSDLRVVWAQDLIAEGRWEEALEKSRQSQNVLVMDDIFSQYGDLLAEQENYQEAISLWGQVSYGQERVKQLYSDYTKQLLAQKEYEKALEAYQHADPSALAQEGVDEGSIYYQWCTAVGEKGDLDQAVELIYLAFRNVELSEFHEAVTQQLLRKRVQKNGGEAIAQWLSSDQGPESMEQLARAGRSFKTVDEQLTFWAMLDEAGVDLAALYPQGVEVERLQMPRKKTDEYFPVDFSRPLVFQYREADYSVVALSLRELAERGGVSRHDESSFTLTLLPAYWQSLPPERRPSSLRECTCILYAEMRYALIGIMTGYVKTNHIYPPSSWSNSTNKSSPSRENIEIRSFPLYNAVVSLVLWNYPGEKATVLEKNQVSPQYNTNYTDDIIIDYTATSIFALPTSVNARLSGKFDLEWTKENLALHFQKYNQEKEDGSWIY